MRDWRLEAAKLRITYGVRDPIRRLPISEYNALLSDALLVSRWQAGADTAGAELDRRWELLYGPEEEEAEEETTDGG